MKLTKPTIAIMSLFLIPAPALAEQARFTVPVTYYKLKNGLKVALSRDTTAPTAVVAVYYNIGFRTEPRNRTGFAHLFEHMMFQGSSNLGKMEFIKLVQANGGILNGSTRFDFTNYFEVVPSNKLETMLWAEADRMKGLAIDEANLKNQQGVVSNEVKVNVLNRPYGGFPWLDMPQYANKNWNNAHNFYGDLTDLDAAGLDDVKNFFHSYYAPNNAALSVVGDFEEAQAKAWIEKYFGSIPSVELAVKPDITEPKQEAEIQATKLDKQAKKPAIAVAYHLPERRTPEHYAAVLLNTILLEGEDSLLTQELVKKRGFANEVEGGINLLGNAFNYKGPMLWMTNLIYDEKVKPGDILSAIDQIVQSLQDAPLSQSQLDRARVKFRARFYQSLSGLNGLGTADLLASFSLFDDDPAYINQIETEIGKVTPAIMQKVARDYFRKTNRTVLLIDITREGATK
jgi:zinc protease